MHTVFEIEPDESLNMKSFFACERTHAAPQSLCWNDTAPMNMLVMSVTLDTSHFEISPLNDSATMNIRFMLVTFDTSHFEMPP